MLNYLTLPASLTLSLSLLLCPSMASAEIYSWTDESGNTVYSDQKTSSKAKQTAPSSRVNYFKPVAPNQTLNSEAVKTQSPQPQLLNSEQVTSEQDTSTREAALTEQECLQRYKKSCNEVTNWQQKAKADCGNAPRCSDAEYLDRKYRPRTTEEVLAIAHRAANRNNRMDDDISRFLNKKYTSVCENQAQTYCANQRSKQCLSQLKTACSDPRSLKDVFQRYDELSVVEKQQIIEEAKKMALANGGSTLDYNKVLNSLIDILVSQALLGL